MVALLIALWLGQWMTKNVAPNPQVGQGGGLTHAGTHSVDAISVKQVDFSNSGGVSIYSDTGAPGATVGNGVAPTNGDIYIRLDGGASTTIYQRRAGAWVGIV